MTFVAVLTTTRQHPTILALAGAAVVALGCARASGPPVVSKTSVVVPSAAGTDAERRSSPAPDVQIDGPRIRVTLKEIRIDDTLIGWDPGVSGGQVFKVDQIIEPLRSRRGSDPKRFAAGECAFEIDADVPFVGAASVIGTGAFSGCPIAWIPIGSAWIKLRSLVPSPPGQPEDSTPARRQIAIHLGSSLLDLRVFAVVPESSNSEREQLEQRSNRLAARDKKGLAEIAAGIAEGCENAPRPCPAGLWLTTDAAVLWGEMVSALAGAVQARGSDSNQKVSEILVSFHAHGTRPITSKRAKPEEIQQIVRANFGSFRQCYEDGLLRNAALQGRIAVRFTIGQDGRVTNAAEEPSPAPSGETASPSFPDKKVVACVVEAMGRMVFPPPPNGLVTVVYPIMFLPEGQR